MKRLPKLSNFPSAENEAIHPIISDTNRKLKLSLILGRFYLAKAKSESALLVTTWRIMSGSFNVSNGINLDTQDACRSSSPICDLCSENHPTSACSNYGPAGRNSASKRCVDFLSSSHDIKMSATSHGATEKKFCPSYMKRVHFLWLLNSFKLTLAILSLPLPLYLNFFYQT